MSGDHNVKANMIPPGIPGYAEWPGRSGAVLRREREDEALEVAVDPGLSDIRESLLVKNDWSHQEFRRVAARLRDYGFAVDTDKVDLQKLHDFLTSKRAYVVIVKEWFDYVEYLRTNPFDRDASPVVL